MNLSNPLRYKRLVFIKRDINIKNIRVGGHLVNLKTFYNQEFLKKMRHFIIGHAGDFSESAGSSSNQSSKISLGGFQAGQGAPWVGNQMSSSKAILRRMNLDSPLHLTVPNLLPRNDMKVNLNLEFWRLVGWERGGLGGCRKSGDERLN